MKTITKLFAKLKVWVIRIIKRIFSSKKQTDVHVSSNSVIEEPINHYRQKPKHNNRKRTRGRLIQEIKIDSKSRFIYHQ